MAVIQLHELKTVCEVLGVVHSSVWYNKVKVKEASYSSTKTTHKQDDFKMTTFWFSALTDGKGPNVEPKKN